MKVEVKVPEVGESVREALLAQWLRKDGERVQKDEILFVIETDKVTLEVSAPADGVLRIQVGEGETVPVGTTVAVIETEAAEAPGAAAPEPRPAEKAEPPRPAKAAQPPAERVEGKGPPSQPVSPAQPPPSPPRRAEPAEGVKPIISSSVRALAEEKGVDLMEVTPTGPGGRITEGDVLLFLEQSEAPRAERGATQRPAAPPAGERPLAEPAPGSLKAESERRPEGPTVRKPMSPIRRRIAERLLDARRNTAMLTTFNEIDMGRVQDLRHRLGEGFLKRYGVRLGMMSFFVKACAAALKEMPEVNAYIDGNDIVYQHFYNIGVAIGAERGLVVPVIRNADRLGFAEIEKAIVDFVAKISQNRLELSDLEGGTFTITNGGIYGSLLSTPILNPPQSAILGMHKIEDRPIAAGGQVVIRPMMYVALSYDHRIIDGREAVTFLRRIKDLVENPEHMLMEL